MSGERCREGNLTQDTLCEYSEIAEAVQGSASVKMERCVEKGTLERMQKIVVKIPDIDTGDDIMREREREEIARAPLDGNKYQKYMAWRIRVEDELWKLNYRALYDRFRPQTKIKSRLMNPYIQKGFP